MPYSTNFFTGSLPDSEATLYTVPSSYVAVVRDVEVFNGSLDEASFRLDVTVPGSPTAFWWGINNLASGAVTQWKGRLVLPPSSTISGLANESEFFVIVSGYLLSSP